MDLSRYFSNVILVFTVSLVVGTVVVWELIKYAIQHISLLVKVL